MTFDKDSAAMVGQPLKVRKDQKRYLEDFKKLGGNPSHYIRIALDDKIERDKAREADKGKSSVWE